MQSLKIKRSFNLIVTVGVIYVLQVPAHTNGFSLLQEEISSTDPGLKDIQSGNLLGIEGIKESFVENSDFSAYDMYQEPWTSYNLLKTFINTLPKLRKRNLEYLAKSSGGYLKKDQNGNAKKEKKDDIDQISKIIDQLVGKHKRGVQTLAKNADFPLKNYKPKLKEVSVGTYIYSQNRKLDDH